MNKHPFPKFCLIVLLTLFYEHSKAHPMGLTVANMTYSKENLVMSTRIFYNDFYHEFILTSSKKNKHYEKLGFDNEDQKDLKKYLQKNIRIWINNKELKQNELKYSFERHDDDAYILIVELSYKTTIKIGTKLKVRNDIMLNFIGGQQQLINVFLNGTTTPSHALITLDKINPEYEFVN